LVNIITLMLISGVFPAELSPNLFIVQITGRPIYIDEEYVCARDPSSHESSGL